MAKSSNYSEGRTEREMKKVVVTIAAAIMDVLLVLLKYFGKKN